MITEFEYKGKWKLPQSNEWLDGTISFIPESKVKLELFGTFSVSQFDQSSKEIILGKTTAGNITLLNNHYKGRHDVYASEITIGTYEPELILIGQHFEDVQDISFRKVRFRAFNLFQWLDIKGITKDINYLTNEYTISYKKVENIHFEFTDLCKGEISFSSPLKFGDFNNEIDISEKCYVELNYIKKTHYEEILNDIFRFIGFVTFVSFEQSYPMAIIFEDDDYFDTVKNSLKESKRPKSISCFYRNSFYNSKYELQRTYKHLVKYKNINQVFPQVIEKWHNSYFEFESIFNLMLNYFKNKYFFSVGNFMETIRAIEAFHRRTLNNECIPVKDYKERIAKYLNTDELNANEKNWLAETLKYKNEPSLKKRLKELLEKPSNSFINEQIPNYKKFSQIIVDTRNYYTHYDKSLEKRALNGTELFEANRILMKLLFSSILTHIGLDNSQFEEEIKQLLN